MVSSRRDDFLGGPGLGPDLDIPAGRDDFQARTGAMLTTKIILSSAIWIIFQR